MGPQPNTCFATRFRGSGGPLPPVRHGLESEKDDPMYRLTPNGVFFLTLSFSPFLYATTLSTGPFTVTNSALKNPFDKHGKLISSKESGETSHGFGVRNIQETANKYNGQLKTQYENGVFTSTVLLCLPRILPVIADS